MALLSVIRRWYHRDQMSIREISRRTGLSRNTLRKYLRSEVVEPRFRTPDRPSKLDPCANRLSAWLRQEMTRPRKQKRTIKQLHADLVSLGYDGSYGRVAAFARAWQDEYRVQQQTSCCDPRCFIRLKSQPVLQEKAWILQNGHPSSSH